MRSTLAIVAILFAAVSQTGDQVAKVSGRIDGKQATFRGTEISAGVKAALAMLQSCIDDSLYDADELKAAENGDHIRFQFSSPIKAKVMERQIEFSEIVFRLPEETGVFWVHAGDKWLRYSKYAPDKGEKFDTWLRHARNSD